MEPLLRATAPDGPTFGAMAPRILVVSGTLQMGGAERAAVTLANAIDEIGYDVSFVVLTGSGPLSANLNPSVELHDFGRSPSALATPSLARLIRRTEPEAVLASGNANTWAVMAARRSGTGVPVVVGHHNRITTTGAANRFGIKDRLWVRVARQTFPRATRTVTVSDDARDELAARLAMEPDAIVVLDNPLDLERLDRGRDDDVAHPWLGERPCILGVGSLRPVKHFDLAIDALEYLPEHSLVILGEGPERPRLQALAESRGVADRVAMPGIAPNPYPSMVAAQCLVSTSRTEAQPVGIMEAIALGAGVVATDSGSGTRDLLHEYAAGTVCRPDAADVARAVRAVASVAPDPNEIKAKRERWHPHAVAREYLRLVDLS